MVSTRQMTVTGGSGVDDGSFDAAGNPIIGGGSGSGGPPTSAAANCTTAVAGTAGNAGPCGPGPVGLTTPNNNGSSMVVRSAAGGQAAVLAAADGASSNRLAAPGALCPVRRSMAGQELQLLDMPMEIMDKICSYVGYKKVAQIRVVSKSMNAVCSSVLNSTFQKLQTRLHNRFKLIKNSMPRRESSRRVHPLSVECDIVETCYMRLSLLQMTFGKHIDRKHICFFAGTILDEVFHTLHQIRTTPNIRPHTMTEELYDLSTMAMEYFKEHLEPRLPTLVNFNRDFIDYNFSKDNTKAKYLLDATPNSSNTRNKSSAAAANSASSSHSSASSCPSPPQSNMVLRKGIRKIKQGMKRYNNQLTVLRNDLRFCKRKSTEQAKQIGEMQKLLAETQKQTLEYAARLDENDKKNEEMSMKISTLLQESNKCKTELQYWRTINGPSRPLTTDDPAHSDLVQQIPGADPGTVDSMTVDPAGLDVFPATNTDIITTTVLDQRQKPVQNGGVCVTSAVVGLTTLEHVATTTNTPEALGSLPKDGGVNVTVICSVGQPIKTVAGLKRKASAAAMLVESTDAAALADGLISLGGGGVVGGAGGGGGRTNGGTGSSGGTPTIGSDIIKKARRVQNKARCQNISSSSSSISSIAGGGKVTRSK